MDNNNIEHLIEKYFSGETTVDEERELRAMLADSEAEGEAVSEARAVMAYFSAMRSVRRHAAQPPSRHSWRRTLVAACAAALAILGVALAISLLAKKDSGCETYVAGVRSTDSELAMTVMEQQLQLMGEAMAGVDSDVSGDMDMISDVFSGVIEIQTDR